MVLGFKRQFAPYVRDGSKTHSIREDKNDRWRVGCLVDAFVDPRQKTMERLMASTPVVRTEAIIIERGGVSFPLKVTIEGVALSHDEMNQFFWRDGFRDESQNRNPSAQALRFWNGILPFKGKIIHWKFPGVLSTGG